jgi:hypothetical protein
MKQSFLSLCSFLSGFLGWVAFLHARESYRESGYHEWEMDSFGDWLLRWAIWTFVIPGVLAVFAFISGMLALEKEKRSSFLSRGLAMIGIALGGLLPFLACVVMFLQK